MSTERPPRRARVRRARLPLALYVAGLGVDAGVGYHSHQVGLTLAFIELTVPAVCVLILLSVILFGDDHTCERAFRLLRWIANRPEPPQPTRGRVRKQPTAVTRRPESGG